jgi:hypothetical protein
MSLEQLIDSGDDPAAVEIVSGLTGWMVHVTENGEKLTRSFSEERFAISFADGQRLRLKLSPTIQISR